MIIDLSPFFNQTEEILINDVINFPKEYLKDTELLDLGNVRINGRIYRDSLENYILSLNVKGKMVLPCSRTLVPTDYEFNSEIEENLSENEEKFKKNQKTIDILPIIWENILMEIPIRIINENASDIKTEGEGWELITDDKSPSNNSLAKLKDLL